MATLTVATKNDLLDVVFYDPIPNTMIVFLLNETGVVIDSDNTVTFNAASGGVTHLSASILFTVSSGTTVSKLSIAYLTAHSEETIVQYDLTNETFSANGTYTISDIAISL